MEKRGIEKRKRVIVRQIAQISIVDQTVTEGQIVIADQIVIKLKVLTDIVPCHRMKSRSLTIKGHTLPLCARCTGILLGYLFFPLLLIVQLNQPLWLGIVLNLPMVLDGWTQKRKLRLSNNPLRLTTGIVSGLGQSIIIVSISQGIISLVL
jgi:uncharacterized membrane protein